MRAKDIHRAAELAEKLRHAYDDRKTWANPQAVIFARLHVETDDLWDEVEIKPTPELVAQGQAAREATIADLEQQLDALGVKDLYTLQEPEEEDDGDDDDDEEDDEEVEAAAA